MNPRLLHAFSTKSRPLVFGMIHVRPLPGTPLYKDASVAQIEEQALSELELYEKHKVDGVILENMWDVPYSKAADPTSAAVMGRLCGAARRQAKDGLLMGLQILAGRNEEALGVAVAAGLDLIRVEGFVFGHLGDEGWFEACAPSLLRLRRSLGRVAESVAVFADVKKKHSAHAVTADLSLAETVAAVDFFRGDGVIVTGSTTGRPPREAEVTEAKGASKLPVLVGSGVTADNVQEFRAADGLIVGSHFKRGGRWEEAVDADRVARFMDALHSLA